MASKISKMSLEELYQLPKITPAVERAIVLQSTFVTINDSYCQRVCRLKEKQPNCASFLQRELDVLIIQDHREPFGKFDKGFSSSQDPIQQGVITELIKSSGLGSLRVGLTSLSRCPASREDFKDGTPPTAAVLSKCKPYLFEEIRRVKPKVIISLGTATTKALGLSKHSNTGNRGEVAISEYGPVVITLHPRILSFIRQNARGSAGMWGPDYFNVLKRDFEKAARIVSGELVITKETLRQTVDRMVAEGQIFIAKSIEDVKKICDQLDALPPNQVRSFDTETTSVDPLDPNLKILTIQFGWKDPETGVLKAGVIPLFHRENKFYDPKEAWEIVLPQLINECPKVGHNAKFDILVLYWAFGIRVVNVVFDTLLLLHSLESGIQGCYSLKTACWDFLPELGFAGYEEDLGSLSALQRAADKEAAKEEAKQLKELQENQENQDKTEEEMLEFIFNDERA